jgi:putative FmdB family regulatory protein
MPLYVFVCPECGIEIEERRPAERMDDPLACPLCGARCTRLTNFAVTFFKQGAAEPPLERTTQRSAHPPNCPCCVPRKGNRS